MPATAPVGGGRDDRELVAAAKGGERSAFDELVVRHQDKVFNMSYRILGDREEALDCSQEIFLSAYRGLQRFDDKARFGTWLYRITVNRCRDQIRRRGFRKYTRPISLDAAGPDQESEGGLEPAARESTPLERASTDERTRLVNAALQELPGDAREILLLRDLQGLSYEEVAEILEVPIGTVRSRLSRARGLLRERLLPILEGEA